MLWWFTDVADRIKWLRPSNTFPFGTENKNNQFYEKIKIEVEDFICNEEKYIEERKKIKENLNNSRGLVAASLTAVIAPEVGTAPAMLLPVVVLILQTAFKIGINAWCAIRIEDRDTSDFT